MVMQTNKNRTDQVSLQYTSVYLTWHLPQMPNLYQILYVNLIMLQVLWMNRATETANVWYSSLII